MFECDVRLCCDWSCKVVFFCFAVFVDDLCLNLSLGCVVIGCVKLVLIVSPFLLMIGA